MRAFWGNVGLAFCLSVASTTGQVWVQQITGAATIIDSIAVDRQNNCFVSGTSFGDEAAVTSFGSTNLPAGSFFARFSKTGELIYARSTDDSRLLAAVGSRLLAVEGNIVLEIRDDGKAMQRTQLESDEVFVSSISACDEHSFVVAGYFRNSITIGRSTLLASTDEATQFAARLNANGKPVWLVEVPSTFVADIAGGRAGGAYLLTHDQIIETNSAGTVVLSRDVFAVRALGRKGDPVWTTEIPGTYFGLANAITVNRRGQCFVTGRFAGIINAPNADLIQSSGRAPYVYSLAPTGEPNFGWMFDTGFGTGRDIAAAYDGSWFIGMDFIDGFASDAAVLKNGDISHPLEIGGDGTDLIDVIAVGRDSSVYVAGDCRAAPAVVGSHVLTANGTFIARFITR
jgi:hypothetical protein